MPNLSDHKSKRVSRILLVGDPGAGKTSAYGSLLAHGQRLFVMDFDDGLDPIRQFVAPEHHKNLIFESLVDKVRFSAKTGYPTVKGTPTAFKTFVSLMDRWVDSETGEDYGPPEEWGDNDWLVVDTLTNLGAASMNYTLHKAQRSGESIRKKDWGDAIRRVTGFLDEIRSLPINVILCAHLMRLTPDDNDDDDKRKEGGRQAAASRALPENYMMRYPATLGQKLPPRVGGHFTCVLQVKRVGKGRNARRIIRTTPDDDVDVKVPVPAAKLEAEYEVQDFWKIVEALRG